MSKGASLAPQEIKMLFAVLPETICKGLFNHVHKKFKNDSLLICATSSIFP